jgi:hypothetical protein
MLLALEKRALRGGRGSWLGKGRVHWLAAFAALSLLAAGCAPTTAGTSSSAPLVVGAGGDTGAAVQQGNTYYLRFDLSLEQFGLAPRDLQAALWVPSGYASDVGDVTSMFGLNDVRVAENWTVELVQVKAQRSTVTTSASFNQSRVDYSLWAVVKVVVPTGIVPGPYRVRGTLQVRSGTTAPLSATLNIAAP